MIYQSGKKASISSKVDQRPDYKLQRDNCQSAGQNTSLVEKIWTLFREQGIMIASILTAVGVAIGVLDEALLHDGEGGEGTASS